MQLEGSGSPVSFDKVYFPFESGVLAYDCASCGATCCRGHGLEAHPSELARLDASGCIELFVDQQKSSRSLRVLANSSPGCFLLRSDNLCGVHAEHGISAKPETCRLFPFNAFVRFGQHLIVGPHATLCPLEVCTGATRSSASDHQELLASLSLRPIRTKIPICRRTDLPQNIIDLERSLVEVSAIARIKGSPLGSVLEEHLKRTFDLLGEPAEEGACGMLPHMVSRLFNLPDEAVQPGAQLSETLISLLPYIRSRLLFRIPSDSAPSADSVPLLDIPLYLQAVAVVAAIMEFTGMKRITFQTVNRIATDHGVLVKFLTSLHKPMVWKRKEHVPFLLAPQHECFQQPYLRIAKQLASTQSKQEPLYNILLSEEQHYDRFRRPFLKYIAEHITGRITTVANYKNTGGGRPMHIGRAATIVGLRALTPVTLDAISSYLIQRRPSMP